MSGDWLLVMLGLHAGAAVLAPVVAPRLGRQVFLLAGLAPVGALAVALALAPGVLAGTPVGLSLPWLPSLGIGFELRLDALALLMVLVVSGIGAVVFAYCIPYLHGSTGPGRFAGLLTLFAGSMLGIVLADDVLLLYVFWELTTVASYLLIGFEDEREQARAGARRALVITSLGGLALLAGLVLLAQAAGTTSLSAITADPPDGGMVPAALVLVLVGAFAKSAQMPLHLWLPGAMVAPTPVSAYLHAAAMVKAGVYLVARLSPAFAPVAPWRPLVLVVGLTSMVLGAWVALRRHDIKVVLAYSTISELGFLIVLLGVGVPEATRAGLVLLVAHAIFKAALFMVAGVVDKVAGTRDTRELSGLGRRLPVAAAVTAISAASLAGLPPALGFVAHDLALKAYLEAVPGVTGAVTLVGLVVGGSLTVAYALRNVRSTFGGREPRPARIERPARGLLAPAVLLAGLTVTLGLVPGLLGPLADAATRTLWPGADPPPLALWQGLSAATLLSLLTLAAGVAIVATPALAALAANVGRLPSATAAYDTVQSGVERAGQAAARLQLPGSLPLYAGVILLAVVGAPGAVLLSDSGVPADLVLADSPLQAAAAAAVVVAALGAAAARRRIAAVLAVSTAGYAISALFLVHGAPDLALTQLLIESLAAVLFVLALRHLPRRFDVPPERRLHVARIAVSVVVGTLVGAFAVVAGAERSGLAPISRAYLERSLPEAGSTNVVNAILVDFRAFDTLGEATVLTVAALGIFSLWRSGRRREQVERGEEGR